MRECGASFPGAAREWGKRKQLSVFLVNFVWNVLRIYFDFLVAK